MPNEQEAADVGFEMTSIDRHMTVRQLLDSHPEAARVFLDRGMACVGCSMSKFETLGEAARNYCQAPREFIGSVRRVAGRGDSRAEI